MILLQIEHACSNLQEYLYSLNIRKIYKRAVTEMRLPHFWFYNKCWGDTTTVSLPTLFFCKKISIQDSHTLQ